MSGSSGAPAPLVSEKVGTTVQTVAGPVPVERLGVTLLNEHVVLAMPGWQFAPDAEFDEAAAFEAVARALSEFREAGGNTIVDASGITLGRDVRFLQDLSRFTGVNIVATTGFPSQLAIPGHFDTGMLLYYTDPSKGRWQRRAPGSFYPSSGGSVEYLGTLFTNELSIGLATPRMMRAPAVAGAIIAGSSEGELTELEELSTRGAARAAQRTGAPVILSSSRHLERRSTLLREEGLASERIVVGHCDDARTSSLQRDRKLAEQGSYVAYDHVGWESASPGAMLDDRRAELVKGMVDAGLGARVILSCHAIGYAVGWSSSAHRFDRLLTGFVPRLRAAGVGEETLRTILVENPARLLGHG